MDKFNSDDAAEAASREWYEQNKLDELINEINILKHDQKVKFDLIMEHGIKINKLRALLEKVWNEVAFNPDVDIDLVKEIEKELKG